MTYDEKEASTRRISLTQEERAYLLKLLEADLKYHNTLVGYPKASQKSKDHHLFLRTLEEKIKN